MKIPELIEHIRSGHNVSVSRNGDGTRSLVVSTAGQRGHAMRTPMAHADYDRLMQELVHALAERHGGELTVDVKLDYYGGQWVEVRSGVLTRRTSRLGISPRHIALLQDMIAGKAKAAAPA